MKYFLLISMAFLMIGCAAPDSNVFSSNGAVHYSDWYDKNLTNDFAVIGLDATSQVSTSLFMLKGAEDKHIHKEHDLTITIIRGKALIHFSEHSIMLKPGDVVIVPKGEVHWFENKGAEPVLMLIASAPFDWNNDFHRL